MADDDKYLHTAQIMKAALPYVDVRSKTTMEFMYKFLDFMGSFQTITKPSVTACGFQNPKINLEGLLSGIKPFCNDREKVVIDRILNILNMKKMYETYSNYMSAMKTMPGFEGFPFGASGADTGSSNEGNPFNFSGFDFSTLLNGLGNTSPFTAKDNQNPAPAPENPFMDHQDSFTTNDPETNKDNFNEQGNTTETKTTSSYDDIINTLKSMIPPDQKDTYENISMLFNDKSYDDNKESE